MPSMLNCLEKISVGKENQLSFHKAQLSNWLGVTCDGEFDEEKYLKHMKRINSYGNYKMILNRMFEAPFKYD